MHTFPPGTHGPWAPNMVYDPETPPQTLCGHFIDKKFLPFIHTHLCLTDPERTYESVLQRALNFVMYIVNPLFLHIPTPRLVPRSRPSRPKLTEPGSPQRR